MNGGEQASQSLQQYGSIDDGKNIIKSLEFHDIIKKVCYLFNLDDEIEYLNGEGEIFKLASSPEIKGIQGSDKRRYLIDLMRLSPRDMNYPDENKHSACLLRYEAIHLYKNYKQVQEFKQNQCLNQKDILKEIEKLIEKNLEVGLKLNPSIGTYSKMHPVEKLTP